MRKAFVETVTKLLDTDDRIVLLLGDISVHAFKDAKAKHPMRVINCGVSEQAMVSIGAGLARAGMYPIMHTIAPFLVERALEQIKVDFGYQQLPGCFVSIGANYDYSTMGCTHHCPGDVAALLTIPDMEVYVPGNADDVVRLLPKIADGAFAYLRLSDDTTQATRTVGPASLAKATVLGIGPLRRLIPDRDDIDYVPVVRVDKVAGLRENFFGVQKVLVLEPFYTGTMTHLIAEALPGAIIKSIGVPRRFMTDYGSRADFDRACGFTPENVARELELLLNA